MASGEEQRWEIPVQQEAPYEFSPSEELARAGVFFVEEDIDLSDHVDAGNKFRLKCNCARYKRAAHRVVREARICTHVVQVVAFLEARAGNVVDQEFFFPSVVDVGFLQDLVRSRTAERRSDDQRTAGHFFDRLLNSLEGQIKSLHAWAAEKSGSAAAWRDVKLPLGTSTYCDNAIRNFEGAYPQLDAVKAALDNPGARTITQFQPMDRDFQPSFASRSGAPWEVRRNPFDAIRQRCIQQQESGRRLSRGDAAANNDGGPVPKRARNGGGLTQRANADFAESRRTARFGLRPVPRPSTETIVVHQRHPDVA